MTLEFFSFMAVAKAPSTIGLFWRRYRVSIIFPIFTISAIAADYTRTLDYKKSIAQAKKSSEELQ